MCIQGIASLTYLFNLCVFYLLEPKLAHGADKQRGHLLLLLGGQLRLDVAIHVAQLLNSSVVAQSVP